MVVELIGCKMKIAIYGSGGVGGYYGVRLAAAGRTCISSLGVLILRL